MLVIIYVILVTNSRKLISHLNNIDILQVHACSLHHTLDGWDGTNAHDGGVTAWKQQGNE